MILSEEFLKIELNNRLFRKHKTFCVVDQYTRIFNDLQLDSRSVQKHRPQPLRIRMWRRKEEKRTDCRDFLLLNDLS